MDAVAIFMHDLRQCPRFTAEEEVALWQRMKAGDIKARHLLILSVWPWAFRVCSKVLRDKGDASSVAGKAATQAIDVFDPSRGRLSTLVYLVSKQAASRYRRQFSQAITLPEKAKGKPFEMAVRMKSLDSVELRGLQILDRQQETWDQNMARQAYINHIMRLLPERMGIVLRARLSGMTFAEIGTVIERTKERAGQIEKEAIARLKTLIGEYPFD